MMKLWSPVQISSIALNHPFPQSLQSRPTRSVSVSVSVQDGIVALGKAHTRSAPSLSSLPKVALETVPMFVWLNTDRSRPWRVECRPLPFSTPLSFRRSALCCSGLSVLRKFLKPLSTSALPSCRPDVISAVLISLLPVPPPSLHYSRWEVFFFLLLRSM